MSAMPERTLADTERLIADLQRQLTECRAERDEALRRETATAEVLQVINSSPGDLAPVFDAILEKAMDLCSASFGIMWAVEQGEGRTVATRGVPEAFAAFAGGHRNGERAATMAMTACPAKFWRSAICLSLKGRTSWR